MSPRSRGRPPGRGRSKTAQRREPGRNRPPGIARGLGDELMRSEPQAAEEWWFDDPDPAERRSWVVPPAHGRFRDLDLERLDPAKEAELGFLIEASHPELQEGLDSDEDMIADGEPFSPRLHIAMHTIVANQLLADDPPATWQTVQRLVGLGYDWHNVMHMIASVLTDDIHRALTSNRPADPGDYSRRLGELPGDWPSPRALGQR